jgi:hypothetical protein
MIIMLFYSLTGMALFSGSDHFVCRETLNGVFVYKGFCGSSSYVCPGVQECVEIAGSLPPAVWNQYNIINFNNIGNALLTVYHFVFNSNFSLIRGKFSFFVNPWVSNIFFISMSIFLFYIFSNLIMISMSKAYMQLLATKEREKRINKVKTYAEDPPE